MKDKYEAALEEIIFAVTRLLFGDGMATIEIYQRIVGLALIQLGVEDILEGLKEDG